MHVEEHGLPCELVQRDNDTKCADSFDSVFKSTGARIKRTTHQSPNLQAFVERFVQTLKHEILNAFCVVNEQQLDHILSRGMDWYNNRRCHSERANGPPVRDEAEPAVIDLATRRWGANGTGAIAFGTTFALYKNLFFKLSNLQPPFILLIPCRNLRSVLNDYQSRKS